VLWCGLFIYGHGTVVINACRFGGWGVNVVALAKLILSLIIMGLAWFSNYGFNVIFFFERFSTSFLIENL